MKDIKVLDLHTGVIDGYNELPGTSESFDEAVETLMAIKSVTKDKTLFAVTKKEVTNNDRFIKVQAGKK